MREYHATRVLSQIKKNLASGSYSGNVDELEEFLSDLEKSYCLGPRIGDCNS